MNEPAAELELGSNVQPAALVCAVGPQLTTHDVLSDLSIAVVPRSTVRCDPDLASRAAYCYAR